MRILSSFFNRTTLLFHLLTSLTPLLRHSLRPLVLLLSLPLPPLPSCPPLLLVNLHRLLLPLTLLCRINDRKLRFFLRYLALSVALFASHSVSSASFFAVGYSRPPSFSLFFYLIHSSILFFRSPLIFFLFLV
jgi:hypothetical protein